MTVYAHVSNGTIVEFFTPPNGLTIEQCFHPDLVWVDVTSYHPQPQVGWTATLRGDASWSFAAPVVVVPTLSPPEIAQAVLLSGVAVMSASNSILNGTYPIDVEARSDLQAEMISLLINGMFTNGTASIAVTDVNGVAHTFSETQFRSYATALGAFVTKLKDVLGGNTDVLPWQPVMIA